VGMMVGMAVAFLFMLVGVAVPIAGAAVRVGDYQGPCTWPAGGEEGAGARVARTAFRGEHRGNTGTGASHTPRLGGECVGSHTCMDGAVQSSSPMHRGRATRERDTTHARGRGERRACASVRCPLPTLTLLCSTPSNALPRPRAHRPPGPRRPAGGARRVVRPPGRPRPPGGAGVRARGGAPGRSPCCPHLCPCPVSHRRGRVRPAGEVRIGRGGGPCPPPPPRTCCMRSGDTRGPGAEGA